MSILKLIWSVRVLLSLSLSVCLSWCPNPPQAELGTYDQTKEALIPIVGDNFLAFLGASAVAGFASAVVSTPADVVKTRMMNQAGGQRAYSSMLGGVFAIATEEGPVAL